MAGGSNIPRKPTSLRDALVGGPHKEVEKKITSGGKGGASAKVVSTTPTMIKQPKKK